MKLNQIRDYVFFIGLTTFSGQIFPSATGYIAQSCDGRVVQLEAIKQEDLGCGFWTIVNVGAIQNVLSAGQELTAENVKREAKILYDKGIAYIALRRNKIEQDYEKAVRQYEAAGKVGPAPVVDSAFCQGIAWLTKYQIIEIAVYLKIKNVFFMAKDCASYWSGGFVQGGVNEINFFDGTPQLFFDHAASLNKLMQYRLVLANSAKKARLYFCCHDGRHWRMMALIKESGQKPKLIILDSLNWRFNNDKSVPVRCFINSILEMLGLDIEKCVM